MVGASEIARGQGVDLQYAQQILQRLRKGGIIDSVRGPSGGYRLCRPASEITLRDILVATEGETFEIICESRPVNAERCSMSNDCGLRGLWRDLRDHVDIFLRKQTLEDLSRMTNFVFAETSPHAVDHAPVKIGGGH